MPAVKNVGEPCAGEPHARFEVAVGGNQASRLCRAAQAPPADPTTPVTRQARFLTPASLVSLRYPAAVRAGRQFIELNRQWSYRFDVFLPTDLRVDGRTDFATSFVPDYLTAGMTVYDVGGGKSPFVAVETKRRLELTVIGLDIDAAELARAPEGTYERVICADICTYRGSHDADVVICQSVLEHVPDTAKAVRGIASLLKPGGVALVFVPSSKACFARLNRMLPQATKETLLFTIFPEKRETHGFPALYDRCTLLDFESHTVRAGLTMERKRTYFASSYFSFFLPLYVIWRGWILCLRRFLGDQAAETFALALRNPGGPNPDYGRTSCP
jgi:2-polyprenyl-3-methyl-5-hydroxy-6-metoxy-1,4-benzoquinol methylase